jgi:hypothetical protein
MTKLCNCTTERCYKFTLSMLLCEVEYQYLKADVEAIKMLWCPRDSSWFFSGQNRLPCSDLCNFQKPGTQSPPSVWCSSVCHQEESWACYYVRDILSVIVWDGPRHITWIFLKFRGWFRHYRSIPIHQILKWSPAPGTMFAKLVNNLVSLTEPVQYGACEMLLAWRENREIARMFQLTTVSSSPFCLLLFLGL